MYKNTQIQGRAHIFFLVPYISL